MSCKTEAFFPKLPSKFCLGPVAPLGMTINQTEHRSLRHRVLEAEPPFFLIQECPSWIKWKLKLFISINPFRKVWGTFYYERCCGNIKVVSYNMLGRNFSSISSVCLSRGSERKHLQKAPSFSLLYFNTN